MPNQEMIIKGLECCEALHNGGEVQCATKCPYWLSHDGSVDNNCRGKLIFNALALLKSLSAFKSYFDSLYGKGLEIANYHMNGDTEPFDNFYDSAMEEYENA